MQIEEYERWRRTYNPLSYVTGDRFRTQYKDRHRYKLALLIELEDEGDRNLRRDCFLVSPNLGV